MSKRIDKIKKYMIMPNEEVFNTCVEQFNKEQKYNEKVVEMVFEKFKENTVENIFLKCIVLNNRYSAGLNDNVINKEKKIDYKKNNQKVNIDVFTMAEKIYKYSDDFDKARNLNDVIALIGRIRDCGGEYNDAYSFATKYCSWFFMGIDIPIVDSKVKGMLYWINKIWKYTDDFSQTELGKDYINFLEVYNTFKQEYGFTEKTVKDIDKYLWQYAKNFEHDYNISLSI